MKRVALIGLDCADPALVQDLLPDLPALRGLVERGTFTPLRSVDPPITVPAWMCMMTGRDPGELGVYGFRNRRDRSYDGFEIVNSTAFAEATPVWETLAQQGRRSVLLGIPGTYPPSPVAGKLVAGPLTPGTETTYTYPPSLKDHIRDWVGEYLFDVSAIGRGDLSGLQDRIREMTSRRFEVARRLADDEDWSFFALVEMGPDRMHHAFWSHHDPSHPLHEAGGPFRDAIRDYYRFLDGKIASLIEVLPDDTAIWVASDHGVQPLQGGIAINEWLIDNGYLTLTTYPPEPTRIEDLIADRRVDWSRTKAWGAGGYYGRIFFNVEGREPHGVVPPNRCSELQAEIAAGIEAIRDEVGRPLESRVLRPQTAYRAIRGIPPDLMAFFDGLAWRSIGTVGWNRVHLRGVDAGPGTANHAPEGIFLSAPSPEGGPPRSLLKVHDALLRQLGIQPAR